MKIIITERQSRLLFEEKISCKCGHSWKKEKDDKHPNLCHMCGWDGDEERYNDKELLKFWKEYLKA